VTAVPDPHEDIDWSKHRGSCRVFYAERRCTCGAVPDPRFRDQLAEAPTREDRAVAAGLVRRARAAMSDDERDAVVDAVAREIASERAAALSRIAAHVDAEVQAATKAARREQETWDRKRVEDYAATVSVELTASDDLGDAVNELYLAGVQAATNQRAAEELRAIARAGLAAEPGNHPVRVPVSYLFDRAAALTTHTRQAEGEQPKERPPCSSPCPGSSSP
jgi:hypothetical protein